MALVKTAAGEVEVTDIASLTEDQWADYQKRLALHAGGFFIAYGWGTYGRWAGPGGATPGDIAAEAILKVLDGTRHHDPAKCPDLLVFLRHVVRSEVSHLAESAGTQRVRPLTQVQHAGADDPVDMEPEGDEPDPLQNCIKKEIVDKLKAVAAQDQDDLVTGIVECLDAEITKPVEMAEYLGVPVETINSAQKRFWRKAVKVLGQPKQEGRS
jgi:hypothetical protein